MAIFSPPAVWKVPSTSMSSGQRMSNIFSMSRNKATSVIESRPSCTGYTAVDGVRLQQADVPAQALLESSGLLSIYSSLGLTLGFTSQVRSKVSDGTSRLYPPIPRLNLRRRCGRRSLLGVLDCLFAQSQHLLITVSQRLFIVGSNIALETPRSGRIPFLLANHRRGAVYRFNGHPPAEGCLQFLISVGVE